MFGRGKTGTRGDLWVLRYILKWSLGTAIAVGWPLAVIAGEVFGASERTSDLLWSIPLVVGPMIGMAVLRTNESRQRAAEMRYRSWEHPPGDDIGTSQQEPTA